MRLNQRSISKVSLLNVLKRRKTDLKRFLEETGIVTYELLKARCDSMGVIPPEESEFLDAIGSSGTSTASISSPAEGLIVLDPPKIVNELTGKEFDHLDENVSLENVVDILNDDQQEASQVSEEASQKKKKKKAQT